MRIAELGQNLRRLLKRVAPGKRLAVTDRAQRVVDVTASGTALDRLVAEGKVVRATRGGLPEPLEFDGEPCALSQALEEIRGEC